MKFELLSVIIILIAIAIICLTFSIWNVFIKKRTTIFSATDLWYGMILGILAGVTANSYIMMITMAILTLWFTIIGVKCKNNQREKDERNIICKNES